MKISKIMVSPVTGKECHFCGLRVTKPLPPGGWQLDFKLVFQPRACDPHGVSSISGHFFPLKKVHSLFKLEEHWNNGERGTQRGVLKAEVWNYVSLLCLGFSTGKKWVIR